MKKRKKVATFGREKKAASKATKVAIRQLPTGVRGLDDILGGGLPE